MAVLCWKLKWPRQTYAAACPTKQKFIPNWRMSRIGRTYHLSTSALLQLNFIGHH